MYQVSDVTGKTYNDEEVNFYRNITQCIFWMEKGNCTPVDVFVGGDHKLVMALTKEDHRRMMPLWMANKPESKSGGQRG